jgi:hypothetical protein
MESGKYDKGRKSAFKTKAGQLSGEASTTRSVIEFPGTGPYQTTALLPFQGLIAVSLKI